MKGQFSNVKYNIQHNQSQIISKNLFTTSSNSIQKLKDQFQSKVLQTIQLKIIQFETFFTQLGQIAQIPIKFENYAYDLNVSQSYFLDLKKFRQLLKKNINKFTNYHKKNWGRQDLFMFIWLIQKYSDLINKPPQQFNQQNWQRIANFIAGKNGEECMFKWLSLGKNQRGLKYPWTDNQQKKLKQLVLQYGPLNKIKWYQISKILYLKNENEKIYRTAKQCRERWSCFLNPQVKKGVWSDEEDIILIKNYLEKGRKWAIISKLISGRTENAVKNRFNLILAKKKKYKYKQSYIQDQDFLRSYLYNLQSAQMMSTNDKLDNLSQQFIIQMKESNTVTKLEQSLEQKQVEKIFQISKSQTQDGLFKSYPSIKCFETNLQFPSIGEIKQDSILKLYSFPSMNQLLKLKSSAII